MDDRVKVGMAVLDQDGRGLGRVARLHPWGFEVVRGFFGPREWVIRWDEVLEVDEAGARVARSERELLDLAEGGLPPWWNRSTPPLVASPRPPGGYAPAGAPAPGLDDAAARRASPDEEVAAQLGEDPGTLSPRGEPDG